MTREDILAYLTNLRKPEVSDPLHRWIGSYNEQRQRLAKFFKWLYSPEMEVGKRPTPTLIENIPWRILLGSRERNKRFDALFAMQAKIKNLFSLNFCIFAIYLTFAIR